MPYIKINHDDIDTVFDEIDLPDEPIAWLHACYNALGCSSIETVPTVLRGIVLVIDEEGKLWDGWQNRINRVASIISGSYCDPIVGDAILAKIDGVNLVPLTRDDFDRFILHFA